METESVVPAGAGTPPTFEPPAPSERPRRSWPSVIALAVGGVVALAILAGFVIRVPYTTLAPGDAVSLPPRITIDGAKTFDPRGDIRLLFVREANHVNLWQYIRARLDSDIDIAKDADVNPGRLTPAQLNDEALEQMSEAKNYATAVALRAAGFKVKAAPGLLVSDLTPGMPAIDALTWGDVILAVDGKEITDSNQLSDAIARHEVGESVSLLVERAGKKLTIPVKVGRFTDDPLKGHKGIGVELAPRFSFPFAVHVDTTNIGGPSAGLAMTLAILDDLTPGDLTGGQRVAVTGTIDPDGNVGEIGGIEQKAVAARAAHATLFIVPQCSPDDPPAALATCKADLARTQKRVGSKIKVAPVATLDQALGVLRDAGGAPVSTTVPAPSTTVAA